MEKKNIKMLNCVWLSLGREVANDFYVFCTFMNLYNSLQSGHATLVFMGKLFKMLLQKNTHYVQCRMKGSFMQLSLFCQHLLMAKNRNEKTIQLLPEIFHSIYIYSFLLIHGRKENRNVPRYEDYNVSLFQPFPGKFCSSDFKCFFHILMLFFLVCLFVCL